MNNTDKQILKNIETRLKTIMIGGLSRFEKSFGYLWNAEDEPNTEQEELMRDKWEDTRTDLLNHANNQIRLALDELSNYIHYKNKFNFTYDFIIDDKNKNRR